MASRQIKASVILGGAITGSFKSAMGTAENGLKRIGTAVQALNNRQRLLGKSIDTLRMSKDVEHLRAEYAAVTRQVDRLRVAQQRLSRATAARQANLDRRAGYRGQLGEAVGVAAAIILPAGSAIRQAAEFDKEMRLIGNTAEMTQAQTDALGRAFIEASKRTGQSVQDIQKAGGFLVAAGLDADRTKASIETIGRTATAAGADIEDLSKASFTLMDSLKVAPKDLQQGLDILAQAGKEGNFELKNMARTLPSLGSAFVALKMHGAEATATLGAALEIARKGAGDPDEAANNMRNFMAKVLSPETLKKAQKNFGLDLYAVIQQAQKTGGNPFEASIEAIMRSTGGDAKKLGQLFQDMQVQNFLRPIMQNWEEYRRIKDKALNAHGVTDRDFAAIKETQAQQFKEFRNAAGRLGVALGHVLEPEVGQAAVKLGALMDRVASFVGAHPKLVGGVIKVAAAFTTLRLASIATGYALTFVKAPFLKVAEVIAQMRAGAEMGRAATMLSRFGTVARGALVGVAAVGWPVVAVIGAIAVGALLVRKYWQPIKAWFVGFGEGVRETVGPAFDQIGRALAPLKPAWDAIAGAVASVWHWVARLVEPFQATDEQLKAAGESGASFGRMVGVALGGIAKALTFGISLFVKLGTVIGEAAGWVAVNFAGAWDTLKSKAGAVIDWIAGKLEPVLAGMRWVAGKAEAVGGAVSGGAKAVGNAVSNAWRALTGGDAPPPAAPPPMAVGNVVSGAPQPDARTPTAPPPAAPPPAAPPPMASARGGAGATTNAQQYHVTIHQQPGESPDALADRVARRLGYQQGIAQRGVLYDGAN